MYEIGVQSVAYTYYYYYIILLYSLACSVGSSLRYVLACCHACVPLMLPLPSEHARRHAHAAALCARQGLPLVICIKRTCALTFSVLLI